MINIYTINMIRKSEMSGFTLFELVVVIIVLGILAAIAIPRLSLDSYRDLGFYQQALATIRYAQKQAIASGCTVDVTITSTQCNLSWSGAPAGCPAAATPLVNPATNNTNFCNDSASAGGPAANFSFDNIGRPSAAQNINFGSNTILVEAETGYAHD